MEKELLFLETSVICVRIRGDGSEVMTTPYQLYVDFQLHIDMGGGGREARRLYWADLEVTYRSYRSRFVALFPCYLSRLTYGQCVQLGTSA